MHSAPPLAGEGFVQFLVRVCDPPPQVLEQVLSTQVVHIPFTENKLCHAYSVFLGQTYLEKITTWTFFYVAI